MKKITKKEKKLLENISKETEILPLINQLSSHFKIPTDKLTFNINYSFKNNINTLETLNLTSENKLSICINDNNFFGSKGILPDFLLENAIHDKNNSFKEFFNLFFNRLFHQYINIIQNRFILQKRELYQEIFNSLNLRAFNNKHFYKFISILHNDFQSKTSLKIILENLLQQQVSIIQNTGKYSNLPIDIQAKLSSLCKLGENSFLGKRKMNPATKFTIIIHLKTEENKDDIITYIKSYEFLNVIDIYINKKAKYDIWIEFIPKKPFILKGKKNILGTNIFLNTFNCKENKILLKIIKAIET